MNLIKRDLQAETDEWEDGYIVCHTDAAEDPDGQTEVLDIS